MTRLYVYAGVDSASEGFRPVAVEDIDDDMVIAGANGLRDMLGAGWTTADHRSIAHAVLAAALGVEEETR